jgi:hypothetical protein
LFDPAALDPNRPLYGVLQTKWGNHPVAVCA